MDGLEDLRPINNTVIVPISDIHRGGVWALQYAKSIASGASIDPGASSRVKESTKRDLRTTVAHRYFKELRDQQVWSARNSD